MLGGLILAVILGVAFGYVFFWPLSEKEKEMPDIIEEYIDDCFEDFFFKLLTADDIDIAVIGYELMYHGFKSFLQILGEMQTDAPEEYADAEKIGRILH